MTLRSLLTVAFLASMCVSVGAHSWYSSKKNPVTGKGCCGVSDCSPVDAESIMFENGGYRWLGAPNPLKAWIPQEQVLISYDDQYHACWWGGELKCLFIPSGV